ncbi:MAG: LysR family transcriptional regulator [Verrucomicrobiales bacterium]|jgi:DNA-binding transcriptional LysR family regulator|nr:LysR family transcriptional regulator [Verrucomicrobiales bacterium]
MELRHLRYFVAVAEELNITRAAKRLSVSQPPLSRQIRVLENELGVNLIERGAKHIQLIPAGEVFFTEALATLCHATNAVKAAQAMAKGNRGKIHICYSPSLTVELLPRILRAFQEELPQVRVKLHELSSKEMFDQVEAGKIDAALMVRFSKTPRKNMVFEELQRYAVCVALAPSHPLASAKKIDTRQLLKERLVGYSHQNYPEYYDILDHIFAPYGPTPPIATEHDSVASLITAVELGHGVALMPESLTALSGPRLRVIPLHPAPSKISVGLTYRAGKLLPLQERFILAARRASQTKS